MAGDVKLHSPIHLTFEALVVRHAAGRCRGEESGPFCCPMLAAGVVAFGASH